MDRGAVDDRDRINVMVRGARNSGGDVANPGVANPGVAKAGVRDRRKTSQSSLALSNLRGLVIVVVLAFHSVLAYLASLGNAVVPFTIRRTYGAPFRSSTPIAGWGSTSSAPGKMST